MEEKVYVVTDGEYSDYHICGIYSSREYAQTYIDVFTMEDDSYTDYRIEEWELNMFTSKFAYGLKPFFVRMDKEGNVDFAGRTKFYQEGYLPAKFTPRKDFLLVYCWAKSEEQAVKIAGERRRKILAADVWGDDQLALNLM